MQYMVSLQGRIKFSACWKHSQGAGFLLLSKFILVRRGGQRTGEPKSERRHKRALASMDIKSGIHDGLWQIRYDELPHKALVRFGCIIKGMIFRSSAVDACFLMHSDSARCLWMICGGYQDLVAYPFPSESYSKNLERPVGYICQDLEAFLCYAVFHFVLHSTFLNVFCSPIQHTEVTM